MPPVNLQATMRTTKTGWIDVNPETSLQPPLGMPLSKRVLDIAVTGPALLLLSPFFAFIALCIKLDNKGPVFFKQNRYGLDGSIFQVYKFRSMTYQPDAGFVQATKHDARVTRIGAFIRRTSIDELPQLINVLKGEMSLVGPRPHPVSLDDDFAQRITGFMQRYGATPGITGWAQINGFRGETKTLEDMQGRFDHDMQYIEMRDLKLDIRIIVKTAIGGWTDANAY